MSTKKAEVIVYQVDDRFYEMRSKKLLYAANIPTDEIRGLLAARDKFAEWAARQKNTIFYMEG